jgi:hypothetical protein
MPLQFGKRWCGASTADVENRGFNRLTGQDFALQNAVGMGMGRKEAIYLVLNGRERPDK